MRPLSFVVFACIVNLWIPGRAAEVDANGVRVFPELPPPGVHPRVYITEAEKAELQHRMYQTEFGKKEVSAILAKARKYLETGRSRPIYDADVEDLDRELIEQTVTGQITGQGLANNLGVVALEAWVNDDAELKAMAIQYAVNLAHIFLKSQEVMPEARFWREPDYIGRDWTLGDEFSMAGAGAAATYDLLYNDMTEEQRAVIRKFISVCISGRRSHGLGWPKTKLFSNWFPLHGEMANMMLVIEGEEGYDPEIYDIWKQGMLDWMDVGLSANGANHEDGYIYYALRGGMPVILAAARRGDTALASHPHFRNLLNWQAMWEPSFGEFSGYNTFYSVNKYLYPEDPVANMFWARRVGEKYERPMSWQSFFYGVLCAEDYDGTYADAVDYEKLGLPKSKFDKRRGVQIVRNGFEPTDLLFRVHARADGMFVGHANVDSGTFELQALGRVWTHHPVGDKAGSFHSFDHSIVHINGRAMGMKPPTVNVLSAGDEGAATQLVADLTYAYNWQWYYGWPVPGVEGRELPGAPWVPEKEDPFELGWPENDDWLPRDISNQPDLGFEGIWQMKKRINEVDHAFRTAIVARGEHPYVLIVDDVKQDDTERLYEWYLSVAEDIVLGAAYENNVLLQEASVGSGFHVPKGSKRLLVRVLGPVKDMPKTNPYFYNSPTFLTGMRFGEHPSIARRMMHNNKSYLANSMFKRLDIPYLGSSGDFVVLLFPYETTVDGEDQMAVHETPLGSKDLPETSWNAEGTVLTVTLGDQVDVFTFTETPEGRREVSMTRNGKPVL